MSGPVVISAFYRFVAIDDAQHVRVSVLRGMDEHALWGSVLVADEGINGTIAGSRMGTDAFFAALRRDDRFRTLETKESFAAEVPFKRRKVQHKPEIVTMRQPVDPIRRVGTYVPAADWNRIIDDPEIAVIDTRNRDEIELGTFAGAVDPQTESFSDFADYAATLDPDEHPRIAMFCTGGIRCEKASSYLLDQGFREVLHLEGGILKYLETVPVDESRWEGECYVFDDRVSVDHDLAPGTYTSCRGCRHALSEADRNAGAYEEGVACAHCVDTLDPTRRVKLRERHRQELLARERGARHIGRRDGE
ncbi:MAG: rhodanese-related sulfurtransferase [Actinomycetota bacterium]